MSARSSRIKLGQNFTRQYLAWQGEVRLRSGTGPDRRLRGRSSNLWQREKGPGFKVRIARPTTESPVWSLNLDCEVASRCFERDPLANKTLFTHQVIDHISQAVLYTSTESFL